MAETDERARGATELYLETLAGETAPATVASLGEHRVKTGRRVLAPSCSGPGLSKPSAFQLYRAWEPAGRGSLEVASSAQRGERRSGGQVVREGLPMLRYTTGLGPNVSKRTTLPTTR